MLSNRAKMATIVGAGLIAIILMIWIFFSSGNNETGISNLPKENVPVATKVEELKNVIEAPTAEVKQEVSASSITKSFVEKFGTYSNHSNYESIKELLPYMTESMATWVEDTYIPQ